MSPRKAIRYSVSADYQPVGYTWEGGGGAGERGAVRSDERGGDARRLAQACKFRILVSLRVSWAKRYYIQP